MSSIGSRTGADRAFPSRRGAPASVVAGLVPAIRTAPLPANSESFRRSHGVDGRDKPRHDGVGMARPLFGLEFEEAGSE
jgi:hypothetical protein